MGNFADNLNLGNRFRPPPGFDGTLSITFVVKSGGGVLNFELGTDVRPEVSTTTL